MPRGFIDAATMSMQKEALRRVREMQRQAQLSVERSEGFSPPDSGNQPIQRQNEQFFGTERGRTPERGNSPAYQPQNAGGNSPQDIFSRLLGGKSTDLGSLGEMVQNAVSSASKPASELLDSFGIDGEKLIILMVMWAVFNEHKDNKLLLMALGYLLL